MITPIEAKDIENLYNRLHKKYRPANRLKRTYYDGTRVVKDLGISIPPSLRGVQQSIGWAKIAVDALNERINFEGWETEELNSVFDDNFLGMESGLGHLDALNYGIGFIFVSKGDTSIGEPEVLVTVESPNTVSATYSKRLRRVTSAIKIIKLDDDYEYGNYFTASETVPFLMKSGKIYSIEEEPRFLHNLGRTPVVQILNRPDTEEGTGHSEISEPIRSITNQVMRTMLGMEVAREFYAAPQRYILGAEGEWFMEEDGSMRAGASMLMDKMLTLPMNLEGDTPALPSVGQFSTNSPEAFLAPLRYYAQIFSAEACIPENYLGYSTVNPTSAEAMMASEKRLVHRAEQRIGAFSRAWREVAILINGCLNEPIPTEDFNPEPIFRNPATPTRAAAADEAIKLVAANILSPTSDLLYRRIGFSRKEREILSAENTAMNAAMLARTLSQGIETLPSEAV